MPAGAISATYIGTVWVAPPTAKPSSTRAPASVTAVGASEQHRLPTTKIAQISRIVLCRPKRSDKKLHVRAPITAPSRMPAAIACSMPSPVSNSSEIWSSAPEMMPVS